MANDIQDTVRQLLMTAIEGAGKATSSEGKSGGGSRVKGGKGLAAGLGAAALAPVAAKGLGKMARNMGVNGLEQIVKSPAKAAQGLTSSIGDHIGSGIGDKVSEKVDDSGGASGILKDTIKDALPFGGGGGGGGTKGGGLGIGKGRRMPVQQSVDIGIPLEAVYNQWTQFEDWPQFMHRVTRVTQEDDCTVSFATKIWGKTKEFTAKIETQRPDERIKWTVSQGITHAGVVTFHELGPHLTRVLLTLDLQPGGMLEKAARGMRHVKRAARGDLHRFKAFIEMQEQETGAWRGVIEDGEVTEEHDPSYDEQREYSDPEAFEEDSDEAEASEGDDEAGDDAEATAAQEDEADDEEEQPQARRPRRQRRSSSNGHGADEESESSSRPRAQASGRAASSRRTSGNGGRSGGSGSSSRRSSSGAASGKSSGSSGRSSSGSGTRGSGGSGSSRGSSTSRGSGGTGGRGRSRSGTGASSK